MMQSLFEPLIKIYKALYLFAYDMTGNYGVALVVLSFFTFIVLYPFNKKAQKLQNKEHKIQAVLAPQIVTIKKQYNGREQYEQLQWLYKRYGYHPLYAIRSALGFVFQIPFLTAAYYMLSGLPDIQGVSWGFIPDLGQPDHLLAGINLLPFIMTLVTCVYALVMPEISKKERLQTVAIGVFFLVLLYTAPSALLLFWTCNLFWSLLDSILSKKMAWVWDFISENEIALHIIFALSLTVGILVPTDIYIKNASQLWFDYKDTLKYFLLDTVKYIVVLLLFYIICWRKKIRGIYLSVLLGLLLGVFLQSYIISIDYGMFDGHEIEWEKYVKIGILNTFIWLFCLAETFVKFRRVQFDIDKIKKYVKPITFCIIAVQCAVLLYTLAKNPLAENSFLGKRDINVLTTENIYCISAKDNIIVFLLDAFDARVFEKIIEKNPSELEELKDFTFYPDTTSVFGYTHTSLPQILTGKVYYNDMAFEDYLHVAWKNNSFYEGLKNRNYDIYIFADGSSISKNAPVMNLINTRITFDQNSMKSLDNLVLFRMAPHYIKRFFYEYNPNEWMNLLANRNIQIYSEDDRKFYLDLKKGLLTLNDRNCFRFYHLGGAHFPYIYNREMEYVSKTEKGNEYDQCLGVLKIIKEYIRQMRQKELFDNSTFVIMADHGVHNAIGSRPLLCIKQPHTKNKALQISNESVSFTQFLPMISQRFTNARKEDAFTSLVRKYYLQQERDLIEYNIVGNAKNIASWNKSHVLESWYKKQGNSYVLGTEIDCTDRNRDFEKYQGNGWFIKPDPYGTFSVGPSSDLLFHIKDYQNQDLEFSFKALAWLGNLESRNVKVFVNGQLVREFVIDNRKMDFSFKIKSNMIRDGKIQLRFDIDHSGIALKEGLQDLGVLWKELKIEAD